MEIREPVNRLAGRMRQLAVRLQTIPRAWVLAAMTALLVGIGLLLVQTSMAQRVARDNALAEADAQVALENLNQSLVDAESGQRGYLLTLDPAYLTPYQRAVRELPGELATVKLRFMQNSDPAVDQHLGPLDALVRTKLDELSRTVSAAQAGDQMAALELVRGGEGKQVMDQIRRHLAVLAQVQRQSRDAAFDDANRAAARVVPLLLAMWLVLLALLWTGYHGERARARAEIAAAQTDQLRDLNARNELLARELAHRVRNLFGVVLSLIGLSARKPGTTGEVIGDITQRIHALSRAHNVATGDVSGDVELSALLSSLCQPYQTDAKAQTITLHGPDEIVPAYMVSPFALVFHELATNAAKYGALSAPGGRVRVSWNGQHGDEPLRIEWHEVGGPPPTAAKSGSDQPGSGFGQRMTEAAMRQIGGSLTREFPPEGARIVLEIVRRS
ncbi:MAG: CHASE3 domain-containing protein [Novosphingobium sp.]